VGRIDLLFAYIAVVMTLIFLVMRGWQARADRRFLERLPKA
jgi:hypothetical protein